MLLSLEKGTNIGFIFVKLYHDLFWIEGKWRNIGINYNGIQGRENIYFGLGDNVCGCSIWFICVSTLLLFISIGNSMVHAKNIAAFIYLSIYFRHFALKTNEHLL